MRLIRFSRKGGPAVPGLLIDGKAVALSAITPEAPASTVDLIAEWDDFAAQLGKAGAENGVPLDEVELHAPVDRPGKIMAIGLNYADHVEEAKDMGVEYPTEQVWFSKQTNTLNGPFAPIEMPKVSDALDYEVEMVAVIGKGGRHISAEAAKDHVFGYMVGNDVSVRDWQWKTPQWVLGKSFDGHGPMGPALVTADEIGEPHRLGIRCYVNGELRQSSNTKHLIFNIWDQIAELSQAMTLKPGDLIFSGTPGGVGFGFKPPKPLHIGDVVRCEIDELGAIENTVASEV